MKRVTQFEAATNVSNADSEASDNGFNQPDLVPPDTPPMTPSLSPHPTAHPTGSPAS